MDNNKPQANNKQTIRRYQRVSKFYDRLEGIPERVFAPWRAEVWKRVEGERILEVGVGTGKNFPYHPQGKHITAIDLTPGMLEQARRRASEMAIEIDLRPGDAQALDFPDDHFDTAVATFVFCSVPDPVQGLRELNRVVRPGGKILLLDHVRSARPLLGALMDLLNPLVHALMGAEINRRTVENARKAGLEILEACDMSARTDIFKLTIARPGK
ncbi:MAG: class I SAM-dependent methyltransferase [Anaerolineaceae bacterium]|nr:class I SAM-dependent methyltransferase [Anaerolineaceae bacterium]